VIAGPTASGKSALSIEVAVKLQHDGIKSAIVNGDSYSLYQSMDIGTAKISRQERAFYAEKYGIEHYLVDQFSPAENINAHNYQQLALPIIAKLQHDGIIPLLVGGSGLYMRTITDDFTFQAVDLSLRSQLEEQAKTPTGYDKIWKQLNALDLQAATTIGRENKRRAIRALEVNLLTGQNHQSELPQYLDRYSGTLHYLTALPNDAIDRRIEARTDAMREQGLEQEVHALWKSDALGETAIKAIGYAEFVHYFEEGTNPANGRALELDDVFNLIAMHTKRLVRRQRSWFERDPRMRALEVSY
jgi:tRNA dimethylallyltransferase